MAGGTAHNEQSYCIPFWPQDLPQRNEWVPSLSFCEYLWREHIIFVFVWSCTSWPGCMATWSTSILLFQRPFAGDAIVDLVAILPWWMDFSIGHFLPGALFLVYFLGGVERRWSKRFETQWEGGGSLTFIGGNERSASMMMIVMICIDMWWCWCWEW